MDKVQDILRQAMGTDCKVCAQFNGLTAKQLFGWERPQASGIVVGAILAGLFIFSYLEYTLVLFACRLLQAGFIALGALVYTKKIAVTTEEARGAIGNFVDNVKPIVVNTCDGLFRLLAWEEPGYSVPILVATIVVAFLSTYLEDSFLILAITLIAFGGTPLYIKNQEKIDPQVQKLSKEVKKLVGQIPIGKAKTA